MWIKEFDNEGMDEINVEHNNKININVSDNEIDEEDEKIKKIKMREIEEDKKTRKMTKEKLMNYK